MREFWFIRHGESESNIGLPSESDETTPLTEKGKEQAEIVAKNLNSPPDLFVISPYIRTAQTANPTLEKFPQVPVETWPIHEYTYLPTEIYRGKTTSQRGRYSRKYFLAADPTKVLGPGGESFNQFIKRIENGLQLLKDREEKFVVLFGHGWFMRATLWHLYEQKKTESAKKKFINRISNKMPSSSLLLKLTHKLDNRINRRMFHFLLFSAAVQTPNCSILKLTLDTDTEFELAGFSLDHLPEHLKKTTLFNR